MSHPRSTSIALLAAAAVVLTGCNSTSGADRTGASVSTTASSSSTDPSSAENSVSSTTSSDPAITDTTSVSPPSRSAKPTPSTPDPSGSAAVGNFDATTVQYFVALCSGLQDKPRDAFDSLTGDLKSKRAAAAQLFVGQAQRLTTATKAMKAAGAPNIPSGVKLAAATLSTYPKIAAAATAGSQLVGTATSQADLEAKFQQVRQSTDDASAPLDDVAEIIGAPAVVANMKQIPTCASVLRG